MNVYMTEEEQLQQIREWLKSYGPTLIGSIIFALVVSFGWRYWQTQHETMLLNASTTYENMLVTLTEKDEPQTQILAQQVIQKYPSSPYASLAALVLANLDISKGQLGDAEKQMFWVIEHTKDSAVKNITIMRLARLFITENKPNQAIDILTRIKTKTFAAGVDSIKGDAYLAQNEINSARNAYRSALLAFGPGNNPNKTLVQMKLSNLPVD
jgi:predicted negative regulator of RcsB-dependent stress response